MSSPLIDSIRAGLSAAAAPSKRDERIDFLRGLALLIIFIDHVPHNIFEPFTLHAFAFADAAEVFFFISGFVAAMVYGGVMLKKGFPAALRKVWRRALTVYGAQLLLLVLVLLQVSLYMLYTTDWNLIGPFRAFQFFDHPLAMLWQALILRFQPAYLDILPAYVLLLAFFPLALMGLKRNVWLVLIPSFAVWLVVQLNGLNLTITLGERWFFNPYSWQFLFVLGAAFGYPGNKEKARFVDSRILFWIAVAVTAVVGVIQFGTTLNELGIVNPVLRPADWNIDKSPLPPLRLLSLFALMLIVVRYLPPHGSLLKRWPTLLVVWCGQSSLQVFSFGALLSSITLFTSYISGQSMWVQTFLCLVGVGLQFVYAAYRQWKKHRLAPVPNGNGA